jgi:hypothetical protein
MSNVKKLLVVGFGCAVLCALTVLFPCFIKVSDWCVSPFWVWLVFLIVALACSHMGLRRLRSNPPVVWAKPLAISALVLAYITVPIQLVLNSFTVK